MGRSNETFSKKEKEKKKIQKRKEKTAKKESRKESSGGSSLDDMIAYVDENGMLTDTTPDPTKKKKINANTIEIGVPKREDIFVDPVHEGKVAFFNDEKGYGFIKDLTSQESYFVHINNTAEPIVENDKVSFEIESGPKGLVAVKVKKI